MHLSDLKHLPVTELVNMAIGDEIENAGRMRKQDLIFAILKNKAEKQHQKRNTILFARSFIIKNRHPSTVQHL